MFNFQKEVVLNSVDGAKGAVIPAGGDTPDGKKPNIDPKVRFMGGGEYFAKYIVDKKIYKTEPQPGKPFELTIKVSDALKGQHLQILIELGLDNDYRGDYGSALWYFRKPILVDVVLPNEAGAAAETIRKAIAGVIPAEYKFIEVSGTGSDVQINGVDSYQKVRKMVISKYDCDSTCSGNSEEILVPVLEMGTNGKVKDGYDASIVTYDRNIVEFGTYDYMIHNLRLPTYENLRFNSPSASEMPIKGVNYVQYSFAYCVPRIGFGGMSVAGQTNHSTTLHTFYVPDGDEADKFEALFNELGVTIETVNDSKGTHQITILPDAYASSQDLKAAGDIKENASAIEENKSNDAEVKTAVNNTITAVKAAHRDSNPSTNEIKNLETV